MKISHRPSPFLKYCFIVLLMLTGVSCKKDPLTLPSRVNFKFSMIPVMPEKSIGAAEQKSSPEAIGIHINEGFLSVSNISFTGRRKNADNTYFSADFTPAVFIDLGNETSSQPVAFDIPQGIYDRMEFVFQLHGGSESLPVILLGSTSAIPGGASIRFEYPYPDPIKVVAKKNTGSDIVLNIEKPSTASLIVDADHLFRPLHTGLISGANVSTIDGKATILINKNTNKNLYNILSSRVEESFRVIFE